jgi:hypothetical protein
MGNLRFALCIVPDEGTDVGELMRLTGMSRAALCRRQASPFEQAQSRWSSDAPLCAGLGG